MDPKARNASSHANATAPLTIADQFVLLRRSWLDVVTDIAPDDTALITLLGDRVDGFQAAGLVPGESELLKVAEDASQVSLAGVSADQARVLSKRLRRAVYEFLLAIDAAGSAPPAGTADAATPGESPHSVPFGHGTMIIGLEEVAELASVSGGGRPELVWDEPALSPWAKDTGGSGSTEATATPEEPVPATDAASPAAFSVLPAEPADLAGVDAGDPSAAEDAARPQFHVLDTEGEAPFTPPAPPPPALHPGTADNRRLPGGFRRRDLPAPVVVPSYRAWADVLASATDTTAEAEAAPSAPQQTAPAPLRPPGSTAPGRDWLLADIPATPPPPLEDAPADPSPAQPDAETPAEPLIAAGAPPVVAEPADPTPIPDATAPSGVHEPKSPEEVAEMLSALDAIDAAIVAEPRTLTGDAPAAEPGPAPGDGAAGEEHAPQDEPQPAGEAVPEAAAETSWPAPAPAEPGFASWGLREKPAAAPPTDALDSGLLAPRPRHQWSAPSGLAWDVAASAGSGSLGTPAEAPAPAAEAEAAPPPPEIEPPPPIAGIEAQPTPFDADPQPSPSHAWPGLQGVSPTASGWPSGSMSAPAPTPVSAWPAPETALTEAPAPEHPEAATGGWSVRTSPRQQILAERMAQKRREEAIRAAAETVEVPEKGRRRRRALEAERISRDSIRGIVEDLLRRRKGAEAGALLQRAAQELGGRDVADLALDSGDRCRALGQQRAAINCFLAAWRADPIYETPLWRLADSCLSDRTLELAVGYLERIADLMRARGDDEGAIGVYRKIVTVAPDRTDIRDLLRVAQVSGRLSP